MSELKPCPCPCPRCGVMPDEDGIFKNLGRGDCLEHGIYSFAPIHQKYAEAHGYTRPASDVGELVRALEKMLLAACWFHEGPYGPSPDINDYRAAKEALAAHRSGKGEASTPPSAPDGGGK